MAANNTRLRPLVHVPLTVVSEDSGTQAVKNCLSLA